MGNDCKVSVIIPCYNVEKYITRCVKSVINQSIGMDRVEIILVNDASTDSTYDVLLNLEKEYPENIIIVNCQENHKQGGARNVGFSYSSGQYVTFVDADDLLNIFMIEELLEVAESAPYDYVECDYFQFVTEEEINIEERLSSDVTSFIIETLSDRKRELFRVAKRTALWGRLYKREFLIKNNIYCLEDTFYEDCFFSQLCSLFVENFAVISSKLYYYFLNNQGTTFSLGNIKRLVDEAYVQKAFLCELDNRKYDYSFLLDEIEYLVINKLLVEPFTICKLRKKRLDRKVICDLYDSLLQMFPTFYENKYINECDNEKKQLLDIVESVERIHDIKLTEKSMCTGCGACYNSCAVGAINKYYDSEGFLSFDIDEKKCIKCGKCTETCPILNPIAVTKRFEPECFAVQCKSEYLRPSSSGGVFPAMAKSFYMNGDYVSGAIWEDNHFVRHIVSDDISEIGKMFSSKYLQSDMTYVFSIIKDLLSRGNKVLFSGCPCQVAGLKAYLDNDYPSLTSVDIVCHGVPSPIVFKNYLDEIIEEKAFKNPKVSFRSKKLIGWNSRLCIEDDENVFIDDSNWFMLGFLSDWYVRNSCYCCHFKYKSVADITIGDFWGIEFISDSFQDKQGTSVVFVNTRKGADLVEQIDDSFAKMQECEVAEACVYNPSILFSAKKHKNARVNFYQHFYELGSTKKAIQEMIFTNRYDVALVLWWSENYGNALTNYALFQTVKLMGKKVCAIDNGVMQPDGFFKQFAEDYLCLTSSFIPNKGWKYLGDVADIYVVGSDQLWNYQMTQAEKCDKFYYLDFVPEEKKKVVYGASYGGYENLPPEEKMPFYAELMKKFAGVGLRENFGKEVWSKFGVEVDHVLDPIFLLSAKEYEKIADTSVLPEGYKYIFSYILSPTDSKRNIVLASMKEKNMVSINVISAYTKKAKENYERLSLENTLIKVSVPQWVGLILNSELIISDSYHCACLALLFHKKVILLSNDGIERFDSLSQMVDIRECFVNNNSVDSLRRALGFQIDYDAFEKKLKQRILASLSWLQDKLK